MGSEDPLLVLWPEDVIIIFVYFFISLFLQQTTETGEDEEDQPLSLAWPSDPRKQVTFLIVLPIVFPLWITLPDVRKPVSKAFFFFFNFSSGEEGKHSIQQESAPIRKGRKDDIYTCVCIYVLEISLDRCVMIVIVLVSKYT